MGSHPFVLVIVVLACSKLHGSNVPFACRDHTSPNGCPFLTPVSMKESCELMFANMHTISCSLFEDRSMFFCLTDFWVHIVVADHVKRPLGRGGPSSSRKRPKLT
ncbi:hypothetical protein EDD16DRAFT_1679955 [Pisolithus croceorrhizus]|nr:hypothetical protein EDD16DRAFT_1679955 [Pisolithus croceorrhizus]KAI6096521.1 hypothetical protein EV401DRAFT_2043424 [Pisolithus croceorrhizus]